jgi:hypothetical protein
MSLSVTHDGSYKDETGKKQRFSPAVRAVVLTMTIGQRIMVLKKDEKDEKAFYIFVQGSSQRLDGHILGTRFGSQKPQIATLLDPT